MEPWLREKTGIFAECEKLVMLRGGAAVNLE